MSAISRATLEGDATSMALKMLCVLVGSDARPFSWPLYFQFLMYREWKFGALCCQNFHLQLHCASFAPKTLCNRGRGPPYVLGRLLEHSWCTSAPHHTCMSLFSWGALILLFLAFSAHVAMCACPCGNTCLCISSHVAPWLHFTLPTCLHCSCWC
jgi:hypothetical protein